VWTGAYLNPRRTNAVYLEAELWSRRKTNKKETTQFGQLIEKLEEFLHRIRS